MKNMKITTLIVSIALLGFTGCSLSMVFGNGLEPPPASEFGLGPRTSELGLYKASLLTPQELRPRKLQTIQVEVEDSSGVAIDGAIIRIDGGMPQHGHGLSTRPRVTANPESGIYEIDGVRFNMGGWWELKLAITTPAGDDSITFNLDI